MRDRDPTGHTSTCTDTDRLKPGRGGERRGEERRGEERRGEEERGVKYSKLVIKKVIGK